MMNFIRALFGTRRKTRLHQRNLARPKYESVVATYMVMKRGIAEDFKYVIGYCGVNFGIPSAFTLIILSMTEFQLQ